MKHSTAMLRIVTTIFILSTAALAAEDLPVRSVLLYPDRAQITRKDNVKLVAGKNRLIIANVSPNLLPDTLRASCAPDCSIVEVSSRLDRFSETVRPRIQALEKKFAAVKEKRDTVSATIQRNQFVLNFVNQLSTAASRVIGEETMRPADSGRWTKAAQFIQNERTARRSLIQKQEEQGRKIDLELAAIQKELDMARAEGEKTARTVEVRLTSSRAQSAEVQVGYNIRGASWSISYGALLAKDGSVEIEMFGNAVQSTGEDWKNVSLGFSTANTE
ncbi:MAG TPA: mucoidy inhibitor MuiA family protein, partial [Leptospiraceae bacterium]|nr:mucoidy inhibitor MuiA family protein [Leptospiraceae bacterium]